MTVLRASLVPLLLLLSTAASAQPVRTTTDPAIQSGSSASSREAPSGETSRPKYPTLKYFSPF